MRLILKTRLTEEQISIRNNAENIDGLEIQLFEGDDLNLINKITKEIIAIHLPFTNNDCHLSKVISMFQDKKYQDIFQIANKLNTGIIVHNDMPQIEIKRHENYSNFIKYLSKQSFTLHIENATKWDNPEILGDYTRDIPLICKNINLDCMRTIAYPLLDICHAIRDTNNNLWPSYSLGQVIYDFNSSKCFVHLSYAHGYGSDVNHGIHFGSNLHMLKEILRTYKQIVNNEVDFILEVREDDYKTFANAKILKSQVLNIWNSI